MKYIRLEHELKHARWDESTGKWHLCIRRPRISYDSNGAQNSTSLQGTTQTSAESMYEEFDDIAQEIGLKKISARKVN